MNDWEARWAEPARDDLEGVDRKLARRVVQAVERFATTGHGDVKRLQGHKSEWRLRVGSWRVRFTYVPEARALVVLRVLPRGRAYRDL